MNKICRGVVIGYVLACIVALALIPLSNSGAFGLQPGPFASVMAILLAAPWSFLAANLVHITDPAWGFLFIGAGMGLNAGIIRLVCMWAAGGSASGTGT